MSVEDRDRFGAGQPWDRGWVAAAALIAGTSVVAGAFAAHGLDAVADAAEIGWLKTGSLYGALHALAILAVVILLNQGRLAPAWGKAALWLFLVGALLFPGTLYALALHGPRWLGAAAPIGGASFILGWLAVTGAALRKGS
ncbi:MAG TPA: DUF423 domain-containing protein [Alphaproteobacteria bacterium]|nr:DUF423 domain-containing protein [Alphaproteobacteria bacterium]